ncbi:MAG TPA: tetrahydrofolate dehydrogenase/cyclohydrolase catalytic domain-containing protein [Cryomorphaceae bacterium]|nr:tetrahydrofolate dehydrogenase/cyclohydrolase catalytic domain-containing protein [Cryomorphaceae bacterium]
MDGIVKTKVLDGNRTAREIRNEIFREVRERQAKYGGRVPHLAAVLVGTDGGGEAYVRFKVKDCLEVGFESTLIRRPINITEAELLDLVHELNQDPAIDGFIVQLPLPPHIDPGKIIMAIDPKKDVDGFHPANVGRMVLGMEAFLPATPMGIIELCKRNDVELAGKHVVVVGRSHIVGSPLSILLSRKQDGGNATVTLCHSATPDVAVHTRRADVVVVALGKPDFLTADMVSEGCVVIDVGTTRVNDPSKKAGVALRGDVRFDEVVDKVAAITPVPGGVGPMTRVALLLNTLKAAKGVVN